MAAAAKPVPTPQELNKLVLAAEELLEAGSEDAARAELQQVLAADPNHKLAQLVLRQLSDDPVARLGPQSYAYTVKPGDSLSKLARQYLGDIHLFYLLARYNGIKVPRQLQEGQVIRLPGKAPVAPASPSPAVPPPAPPVVETAVPAPPPPPPPPRESEADSLVKRGKALRATDVERAHDLFGQAAKLGHPEAPALAEDARKSLIAIYSREARKALARQDLDGSLKNWDKVLAIDPGNETALSEQRKVRALKAKADKLAR
jgi:LysM repeat protein